ncbi:rhodanese-like domain-containing protein [Pseudarthrobacter sp. L19]|uniref:rhodanese-like domain-containing protein n=1 Tax=Pseudarthrobacter sp. L19 TaxID=3423951 RepID=UPI003D79547E
MNITPNELNAQINNGTDAQIVDVREADEVAAGMIVGARHIPLGELRSRLAELDKSRPVVAVCRSGRRSAAAADQLAAAGFTAYTMTGGMLDWSANGLPAA